MKKCPKCGAEYKDANTICPSDGTVLEKTVDELMGKTLAGKYRIDEFLSEGGMGTVYRATHTLMDKTVAVKVLHPALAADDKIVARFSREARAASRLSHPHALSVTDFGEDEGGVVFLVMEYLNGVTLKEVIRGEGPMPLTRAVEIMRQVCGALDAAHAENVVHRDLKSDNIMLLDVAGGDWVKVLDFGIAKIRETDGKDPELTAPNLIIGTPQYMSPEQCSQSSEIDARSDIYSLGVILFEMFVGHVPFSAESPTGVMMKHLQDEPPDLLKERSDLSPEVANVVKRALAKRPDDRFQSAGDLADALTNAADDNASEVAPAAANTRQAIRDTNRIVVPTGSNDAPRTTVNEDYDEETMVRARPAVTSVSYERMEAVPPPPPPRAEGWKAWRMAFIALAGVIVIGGVLYALIGKRPAVDAQTPPLTVDPNSVPVQPGSRPTGQSEQGIAPNSPPTTTNINSNTQDTNQNQNSELPSLPPGDLNINANDNSQTNSNSGGTNPSNSNSNNDGQNNPPAQATPPKVDIGEPPPLPSPTTKMKKGPQRPAPSSDQGGTESNQKAGASSP
jgi:serine/threonine-protein kinase